MLEVISRSAFDLHAVFETVAESSVRLCGADRGAIHRFDGDVLRMAVTINVSGEFKEFLEQNPIRPGRHSAVARVALERRTIHIPDVRLDPEYTFGAKAFENTRTILAVPILKGGDLLGVMIVYHVEEVRPFTDKQIALVETFADQAAIAIENVRLFEAEQQRTRELTESLQQQTATADVLKVISRSTFDLQAVLDTLVESAARLCEAEMAAMSRQSGETYRQIASYGYSPELNEFMARNPIPSGRASISGRVMREGRAVQIADVQTDPEYEFKEGAKIGGIRTMLGVPLLREGSPIGMFALSRTSVRPFTDKQIALVETFADQAAIAIENVRLFEAEQQRTRELTESLEQQTATSEVLQVISSSPGELRPVFETMLASATRICEAGFGMLWLAEGEGFRSVALHGVPPDFARLRQDFLVPYLDSDLPFDRLVKAKQLIHVADIRTEPGYVRGFKPLFELADVGGARTLLLVPMLKEQNLVGAIAIYRQQVRPFADKQIALVANFAAQAVIAIENARLLNELRQRTDDLTESLEQQTATSEVLQVISSSPGDLEPVFAIMLENAARICDAHSGNLLLHEDGAFRIVAMHGPPSQWSELRRREPTVRPPANDPLGRLAATRLLQHVTDMRTEEAYIARFPGAVAAVELGGLRTLLAVPILKDDTLVGMFAIYRQVVRPFTDKQIALVQNFAAQAVIAIENARLLNELRDRTDDLTESLEQQTATSEVLQVISSSPGDLQPVFASMLENATRICDATFGAMQLREGDGFRRVALYNAPTEFLEFHKKAPVIKVADAASLGRITTTKEVIHILDLQMDDPDTPLAKYAGARSLLVVPLLKESELIGAFGIYRREVRPFTDKQIKLAQNFAAQAVIAIENTRLLNELRQRTADLTESLEQQTATSEVLRVISSSPSKLEPVFQTMLANATRICEAKFGILLLYENGTFRVAGMHNVPDAYAAHRQRDPAVINAGPHTSLGRVVATKRVVHISDYAQDAADSAPVKLGGARSLVAVPMLKDDELIGTIVIYRQEVRPFTDRQVELVKNFAAQAVIAIENTRLLNELRQRTDDLTESLEQQTATSEVLRVISSSSGDLAPVFQAILANATRICGANFGALNLYEGGVFPVVATHNAPSAYVDLRRRQPMVHPGPSLVGRVAATKQVLHIADFRTEAGYLERDPSHVAMAELAGARTMLVVPMLKENDLVGTISIFHQEVRPFTDKQIELVQNFAAQAVIAIENARLLNELRQRTDDLSRSVGELRALGEVSQAVNSTLDLQTVLATIVAKAVQLSRTEAGAIYVFDDVQREFHLRATYGMDQDLIDALTHRHIGLDEPNVAEVMAKGEPIQVADLKDVGGASEINEITLRAGYRARLVAPLLRGAEIVGMLVVRRRAPGAFPQNTVDLIKTFAAQSVLAIQNARLFHEIEDKGRQLEVASRHKSQFLANMSHELRTPLNAILGYTELILDDIYGEAPEKMRSVLERVQTNGKHLLGLINDVLDLSKIEAGQLTLSLTDYSLADLVQGVYVAVEPLAAQKNLALTTNVAKGLPVGHGDERLRPGPAQPRWQCHQVHRKR